MDFSNINYLAVAVSSILAFALGSMWYTPILFGKHWQKEVGLKDKDIENGNMPLTFGGSFILIVIMNLGVAVLINSLGLEEINLTSGALVGFFSGVTFVATAMGINLLYEQKTMKLWLINAGYQVIYLVMAGAILGAWR